MSSWIRVARVDELSAGGLLGVEAGGQKIVLANVDGNIYALLDQCSHEDLPLSAGLLEGDRLECIWHGATFDVCSGQATGLPAIRPVRTFDVDIRDAEIFVDLD